PVGKFRFIMRLQAGGGHCQQHRQRDRTNRASVKHDSPPMMTTVVVKFWQLPPLYSFQGSDCLKFLRPRGPPDPLTPITHPPAGGGAARRAAASAVHRSCHVEHDALPVMVSMKRAAKDGTFRNQTMLCCTGQQIASQPRDD